MASEQGDQLRGNPLRQDRRHARGDAQDVNMVDLAQTIEQLMQQTRLPTRRLRVQNRQ